MSDTVAGIAPEALEALVAANKGIAAPYGNDDYSKRTADLIRGRLNADADVRFLVSGTAANAIALSMMARSFESILLHEDAHANCDELGAPGYFGHGMGLRTLPGPSAQIDHDALVNVLNLGDSYRRQPLAGLSLTNATEYGTIYKSDQLRSLVTTAKDANLLVHVDGARLANAAAAGFDLEVLAKSGVDLLVFGASKTGAAGVEALVIFNKSLAHRLEPRLKQAGQLVAKSRYHVASMMGLLETGAWERYAAHANMMARRLADGIIEKTGWRITHPVEANLIFIEISQQTQDHLAKRGWLGSRFNDGSARFACHWATTDDAIEAFLHDMADVANIVTV